LFGKGSIAGRCLVQLRRFSTRDMDAPNSYLLSDRLMIIIIPLRCGAAGQQTCSIHVHVCVVHHRLATIDADDDRCGGAVCR